MRSPSPLQSPHGFAVEHHCLSTMCAGVTCTRPKPYLRSESMHAYRAILPLLFRRRSLFRTAGRTQHSR